MKDHSNILYGILAMIAWIAFLAVLFGSYLLANGYSADYFIDEETGGWLSLLFFTIWAAAWYRIGAHYRKVFLAQKEAMKEAFPKLDDKTISKCIMQEDTVKAARTLAIVFGTAVPWYAVANVRSEVTTRNAVYIGILMTLTLACAWYYHAHKSKVE